VRSVAFTNQKGGTAKTTSAVSVAAALAEGGKKVLLVDLDPQGCASTWCGVPDGGKPVLEALTGNGSLSDVVSLSAIPGVDVVPATEWLSGVDRALAGEVGAETLLRKALHALPKKWDFVLVDCPPSFGLLSVSALVACREVFVPVEVSTLAVAGLVRLVQTVERVRERLNPELRLAHILPVRVDMRTNLSHEVVDRLRDRFGALVLQTVVRETVRLREAYSFQKPITAYDPKGPGAEDYRAVALELLKRTP